MGEFVQTRYSWTVVGSRVRKEIMTTWARAAISTQHVGMTRKFSISSCPAPLSTKKSDELCFAALRISLWREPVESGGLVVLCSVAYDLRGLTGEFERSALL